MPEWLLIRSRYGEKQPLHVMELEGIVIVVAKFADRHVLMLRQDVFLVQPPQQGRKRCTLIQMMPESAEELVQGESVAFLGRDCQFLPDRISLSVQIIEAKEHIHQHVDGLGYGELSALQLLVVDRQGVCLKRRPLDVGGVVLSPIGRNAVSFHRLMDEINHGRSHDFGLTMLIKPGKEILETDCLDSRGAVCLQEPQEDGKE